MKSYSLFILFPMFFALQNNKPMNFDPYNSDWKQVTKYEEKGLPRSAWDEVKKIHSKAIKANNTPQIIKTFVYMTRFQQELEENGQLEAILAIENYIKTHEGVEKQILQSFLGQWYQNYAMQNLYKLRNQTALSSNGEDFRTWSLEKLQNKSAELYLSSIETENTKYNNVEDYESIISEINNTSLKYRPTLYELLIDRALIHFSNTQSYITEPIYKFQLDDSRFFGKWSDLDLTRLEVKDKSSKLYQATTLYHKYLNHFKKEKNELALADTELDYLRFIFHNSTLENKNDLYVSSLERLAKANKKQEIYSKIKFEIASQYIHHNYGTPKTTKNDKAKTPPKVIAYNLCQDAISAFPKSEGAYNCKNLIQQIEQKSFSVQGSETYLSQQKNKIQISYSNITELKFKVYKVDTDAFFESIQSRRYERNNMIKDLGGKLINEWNTTLPDFEDYENHTALEDFPALKSGHYIVQAIYPRGLGKKDIIHQNIFQVSNISYDLSPKEGQAQTIVRNRNTGAPIEGATVKVYKSYYNRQQRKNILEFVTTGTSDNNGLYSFNTENNMSYILRVASNGDEYFHADGYRNYKNRSSKTRYTAHIFTDRSIYRPGQKIHFKTLITSVNKDRVPAIVSREKVTIKLKDANYQDVKELQLTTNEYGSIQGVLDIPQSGLTGNFRIEIITSHGSSSKNIKVEEYKRPQFEVNLKDLTKTYILGDKVKIEGNAKAMAGVNLDGASVQYSIKRTTHFPYYRWQWRMPYYGGSSEVQIAHGKTITDEEGNFMIEFDAIPDKSTLKKYKPQFNFSISVDVTDINGETHSDTKNVSMAYHSVQLKLAVPKEIDIKNPFEIISNTTNMDGKSLPVSVTMVIHKLIEPNIIPEQSTWSNIDTILHSKANISPNDPQHSDQVFESLKVEKQVFEKNYTNTKDYKITAEEIKLKAGVYRISLLHKDKSGIELETIRYITITDFDQTLLPKVKFLYTTTNKTTYQPGEKLKMVLGSGYEDIWVFYEVIKKNNTIKSAWAKLGGTSELELDITEKDRGGFHIRTSFVLHNKLYQEVSNILVPWSNKDLKIEYLSYRDHLEPGSKEEWRIKISGAKGDQVTAELLAGMYDASLDEFVVNQWKTTFYPLNNLQHYRNFYGFGIVHLNHINNSYFRNEPIKSYKYIQKKPYFSYSFEINRFGSGQFNRRYKSAHRGSPEMDAVMMESGMDKTMAKQNYNGVPANASGILAQDGDAFSVDEESLLEQKSSKTEDRISKSSVQIRKNLKETVFFYPQLHTDKNGEIEIRFTMNEALTKWKFMTFAHSKNLEYAFDTKEIITRKKLMVFPLAPRFFREGDQIQFTSKVSNLSDKSLDIDVKLELFDALTNEAVQLFDGSQKQQNITLAKDKSGNISWKLKIPHGEYQAIGYRVIAQSGAYGDGEENTVAVVTNRMLVTETMPLPVKGSETKSFVFQHLKDNISSPTLDNFSYTLEYTANPVWYAVQALPYMDNSHPECSEFVFNRYFSNALASHIAHSSPRIQAIFDRWRAYDSDALLSNLSKNQELKSALLEETPWVMEAINEEQQKKNIALLFDLNKIAYEKSESIHKLRAMQNHEGAFSWFPGGRSNRYMTQNIVEGIGHLIHLGVIDRNDAEINEIIDQALPYLDKALTKQYLELKKWSKDMKKDHLGAMAIHYLYMRSFFKETKINKSDQSAYDYYYKQAEKYGLLKGVYLDGMVALVLHRTGKQERAIEITNSLAERALYNDELGMYWNENRGYFWHQLPIERQALLIETFTEVAQDQIHVDQLKTWLLKNKQTNNWKTTKATAAAIYALLLANPGQAQNMVYKLGNTAVPRIKIANKSIDLTKVNKEAGTGYFKIKMDKTKINKSMANVEVHNPNDNIAWGSIYWQYFEDLDKIKSFKDTPLKMTKELYKELVDDRGKKLVSIDKSKNLTPGDKIIVRVILEVDRDMEYVHLKDMRASGLEPIHVMSSYKWQGGLGYYESTKDLATHFFMDYLPKGKYVFEYPLRVAHKGDFSNGITTIQCMYAPEFTSHSVGRRILVE